MNQYENIVLQYDNQKEIEAKYLIIARVEDSGVLTISALNQLQLGTL
ncbi:MAG: hypothetical protein Q9M91_00125 [Candidatus Dojkabacteria bacterium]|nr:hypothetical protein [Candidatus Dojkabacteria bacterium]